MIGMTTCREPVRGIMAKQMLEHMAKMAALREKGVVQYACPKRKLGTILVGSNNE